jgi:regulation of enolase protein 1 (concanavalin A-like superfamily)
MERAIRAAACVALALVVAGSGHGGDKEPQEIKGWGKVIDPEGDCTVKADKGKVTITVPGTNHNLNPSLNSKAPRVMQEVEGDFVASVKVSGDFDPGEKGTKPSATAFNGAGLLLWKDEKNCVRLERNIYWVTGLKRYNCYPPLFEYYKGGVYQKTDPPPVAAADFFKGRSTYLRLERKEDKLTASYSHDGKEWTAVKEITVDLPAKLHVGVAAVNSSEKPFMVEFEELAVTPKK